MVRTEPDRSRPNHYQSGPASLFLEKFLTVRFGSVSIDVTKKTGRTEPTGIGSVSSRFQFFLDRTGPDRTINITSVDGT